MKIKWLGFALVGLSLITAQSLNATVSSTTTQTSSALGNGSNQNFTISFPFLDNDHIKVWRQDESTTPYTRTQLTYGNGAAQFTITGGDPGTTVHLGTAPTTSQRVVIKRATPQTQTVDYSESEAFPASDHEEAMDKDVYINQELNTKISTKLGLNEASQYSVPTFPDPSADKFVLYNHAGSDLTTAPSSSPSSGQVLRFSGTSWDLFDLTAAIATLQADINTRATQSAFDILNSTVTSHVANVSNPHSVTATQVGKDTAQWNASKIQSVTVNDGAKADGKYLKYDSGTDRLIYSNAGILPTLGAAYTLLQVNSAGTDLIYGLATTSNISSGAATASQALVADGAGAVSWANPKVATVSTSTSATYYPLLAASSSNGIQAANLGTGLTFNPSTNVLTTTTFSGALSGNASTATSATSATTATNATNATTVAVSNSATYFPLFVASSSNGNQAHNLGTGLTFNPSTNVLATTTFSGALTGTSSGNTTYSANQYGVVLSGSGNTMSVLAPDASTSKVLTSGGSSANPTWQTPTAAATIRAWTGYFATNCSWSTTSTTYANPTDDGSCTFTERTNTNMGTVTASGSTGPGIQFTPLATGTYEVCAAPVVDAAIGGYAQIRLIETVSATVLADGMQYGVVGGSTVRLCGNFVVAALDAVVFKIQMATNSGTMSLDASGLAITSVIEWSVKVLH